MLTICVGRNDKQLRTAVRLRPWGMTLGLEGAINYFPVSMWQLRLLVDLVTDHGSSSGVQHRIGNAYSSECAKCVEDCEDTPFHIICECPAVTVSKRLWFGCEKVLPEEIKKFSIRCILGHCSAVSLQ